VQAVSGGHLDIALVRGRRRSDHDRVQPARAGKKRLLLGERVRHVVLCLRPPQVFFQRVKDGDKFDAALILDAGQVCVVGHVPATHQTDPLQDATSLLKIIVSRRLARQTKRAPRPDARGALVSDESDSCLP
jgi:hypothetical protein